MQEGMIDRIIRAIRLDPTLYREVADDESYMNEGIIIVAIVTLLSAFGSGLGAAISDTGRGFFGAFLWDAVTRVLLGWLLWAVISYFVGNLLGGKSSVTEMARTLAYAQAPAFVTVLGFIPCIGWIFVLAGFGLSIAAGVIAIRESMEFDTMNAVITAGIGILLYVIASVIITFVFGGIALAGSAILR